MKDFNAAARSGRVNLQWLTGLKAVQLSHHIKPALQEYTSDAALIHVSIIDILRCKNDEELKELPNNVIMTITHPCQKYNIGKIFFLSIVTCTRAFANIVRINEGIKNMCISSNFEFIQHNRITGKNLWKDRIHLTKSSKVLLARNL